MTHFWHIYLFIFLNTTFLRNDSVFGLKKSHLAYVHTFALQTSNYGINKMKGKNNKYNIRHKIRKENIKPCRFRPDHKV